MIASIEIKSLDFDDENFSPVFTRDKQEHFFELSDRAVKDFDQMHQFANIPFEEFMNKYALVKPNHTFFRELTHEKFLISGVLSYLLLRELPLRNFYARSLVMFAFWAKWYDFHNNIWFPFFGKPMQTYINEDRWTKFS